MGTAFYWCKWSCWPLPWSKENEAKQTTTKKTSFLRFFFFYLSLEAKSDVECSYTAFVKSSLNYNQRTPRYLLFQFLSGAWDLQIKTFRPQVSDRMMDVALEPLTDRTGQDLKDNKQPNRHRSQERDPTKPACMEFKGKARGHSRGSNKNNRRMLMIPAKMREQDYR